MRVHEPALSAPTIYRPRDGSLINIHVLSGWWWCLCANVADRPAITGFVITGFGVNSESGSIFF